MLDAYEFYSRQIAHLTSTWSSLEYKIEKRKDYWKRIEVRTQCHEAGTMTSTLLSYCCIAFLVLQRRQSGHARIQHSSVHSILQTHVKHTNAGYNTICTMLQRRYINLFYLCVTLHFELATQRSTNHCTVL